MLVYAHVGHWTASLMYLLPVVFCFGLLLAARLKDRRSTGGRRPGEEPRVSAVDPQALSRPLDADPHEHPER